ncbi:MAG: hypothetical protein U0Q22_05660 [Acidimicrobiales bacterium]
MIWIFVVLSALVAFVVAAVAVGSVTAQQAGKSRPAVYDLDDAVVYVGDHVDPAVSAVVSYDDVRQVLLWHLDYLQTKGVASYGTDAEVNAALVVVTDDEPLAYILGRADDADIELTDEQVVAILTAQEGYYRSIGAFGPQVTGPDDPT